MGHTGIKADRWVSLPETDGYGSVIVGFTFTYLQIRSSEKTATSRSLSGVERELRNLLTQGADSKACGTSGGTSILEVKSI